MKRRFSQGSRFLRFLALLRPDLNATLPSPCVLGEACLKSNPFAWASLLCDWLHSTGIASMLELTPALPQCPARLVATAVADGDGAGGAGEAAGHGGRGGGEGGESSARWDPYICFSGNITFWSFVLPRKP